MLGLGNILTKGGAVLKFPNDYSFNFDGSNDYLLLPSDDNFGVNDTWSISFWFKSDSISTTQALFGAGKSPLGTNRIGITLDSSQVKFNMYGTFDGTNETRAKSSSSLSSDTWYHLVATNSNGTLALYINNVEQTGTSSYSLGTGDRRVIGSNVTFGLPFDGLIDEVAIWDTALSASDVAKIASKPVDFSKASTYATDRTSNLKLWLRAGDKVLPENDTAIARQDFYTDFDGTDDYVDVGSQTPINNLTLSNLSFGCWFKTSDTSKYLFGNQDGNDSGFSMEIKSDGKIRSIVRSATGSYLINDTTSALNDDVWHHIMFTGNLNSGTASGSEGKIYIDGVYEDSASWNEDTTLRAGDSDFTIGTGAGNTSNEFEGQLSSLALYQTALDAQTISQMAKSRFTPMRDNRFSVVSLDGTNNFIDCGNDSSLQFSGSFSIGCWFRTTDATATNEILISKADDGVSAGWLIRLNSSRKLDFNYVNSASGGVGVTISDTGSVVNDGQWYHVMLVHESGVGNRAYKNGVLVGSNSTGTDLGSHTPNFHIGNQDFSTARALACDVSSASAYNVAKSTEEVYAIYQQGITYDESSLSGLVGYWRMGDDTSKAYPTIADSSSNSNDGTITNGASDDIVQQMVAGYDLGAFESSSEELSANHLDNGDFSDGNTDWAEVGDFTISNGVASITSASQYSQLTAYSSNFLNSGKTYKLEVDITTLSISGAFAYRVSGGAVTAITTSEIVNNKYTTYFTMTQDGWFWFQTTGSYTGLNVVIDNVSIKEVLQSADLSDTYPAIIDVNEPVLGAELSGDPTFDDASNWSISLGNGGVDVNTTVSGKLSVVNANGTRLQKHSILTVGKLYKVTFVIDSYSSGRVRGIFDTDITFIPTGAGTYSRYFVASNTYFLVSFDLDGGANMTMTDISIKKILGNVGTMTNFDNANSGDIMYGSVLPDQSFLTGANSSYGFGSFDGTNDIVTASAVNTDYKSVSLWIKPSTTITPASSGVDFMFFGNWTFGSCRLGQSTSDFTNELITNTDNHGGGTKKTAWIPSSGETIPSDSWTHIAFVWDGSKYVIYYNGQPQTVVTASNGHAPLNTNKDIRIGTGGASSSSFFDGDITGVAFWNKSLTDAQILSIYNNGRHSNLYTDFSDNLITYLAFGNSDATSGFEDTSSTIYDRSGKSNHGTVSGTTLQSPPNAQPEGYAKQDVNRSTTTP